LPGADADDDACLDGEDLAHPAFSRRRARVSRREAWLERLGRYGELDFQAAAEAAVARHGVAVLPAVPVRFWGRDVVVPELAAALVGRLLGRDLAAWEVDFLLDALLDVPGTLHDLDPVSLQGALARRRPT
jgi:hypothetical protein